jgi:hypothetical protein
MGLCSRMNENAGYLAEAALSIACFANSVTLAQFFDFTTSTGASHDPPTQATLLNCK